ncbi:MAG: hybrid sensor histidine kinase/response regulator, partial [Mesorhizobium sp.]
MVADSHIRQDSKAAGADRFIPDAPKRQVLVAPPLAPDLPAASHEGLPFLTIVAIVVLAGLAHLTGAPIIVTIGLAAVAFAGLA